MLSSSPKHLRYSHEKEVERLERAVKRAESMVNKDKTDRVQLEALRKAAKEEKSKQMQGKGEWHMKQKDKRELLMKARYEALAAEGGKRAVKKAIEKKQKKVSQKEKRSRPYGRGEGEGEREGRGREDGTEVGSGGGWDKNRQDRIRQWMTFVLRSQ
ncbi:hypothetical protein BDQ17DRAFT_1443068 [Cyathus striatus]|nr:hypothetical protein BDQ17DRAFT_1443068 [Cyathus striatus]